MTSAETVSTKTFYFDQVMRFGVPFGVFFLVVVAKLVKELMARKLLILSIAVVACTIAIATYIPGIGAFAIPIVFGVAISEVKNGSNPHRGE
jgi:hypothetical protein